MGDKSQQHAGPESGTAKKVKISMRTRLLILLLIAMVVPLFIVIGTSWRQFLDLGNKLTQIAVGDSSKALNDIAIENIERLSTDTAMEVANFLYNRDDDILFLSKMEPSEALYREFLNRKTGRVIQKGEWVLSEDGQRWVEASPPDKSIVGGLSTNPENNDNDGFHYRTPETFTYADIPLYDEITYIDLDGNELLKVVAENSPKTYYPMNPEKQNVSARQNTYVKAESYFQKLKSLNPGEIFVSDVIGAYVGSNYIGMYAPDTVAKAAEDRGYDIPYDPGAQAYAGEENPNGRHFEGIVRWASPVADDAGNTIGYVTFALNHDHIMEFVDHITPMNERYKKLPSAFEGNYAFIWDYQCRSICHPRHHSIYGFDPKTGDPQIPWLESSIYDGWQISGLEKWTDYVKDYPVFHEQSRTKRPAPALTQAGLVGLDGRYLNNAPQCTGWMDLTKDGGSGSFYILWSGIYKLTTAAAIPYYTGQYAPSEDNGFSRRGFGFVTIGAGLEDFTNPAQVTAENLKDATGSVFKTTVIQMSITGFAIVVLVVIIAIMLASYLTDSITKLIKGVSRFRAGERQFRFNAENNDEFGTLADAFDEMADSIADSVNGPLVITDLNRKIIYMNEAGLAYFDQSLDELVGADYSTRSVYPIGSSYCPITALIQGREADVFYLKESGRYLRGKATYLQEKDGRRIGYVIMSTDVTEIMHATEKAEQASRAKSQFLSNMSHEMRTPMNAIIGMTAIGKAAPSIEKKDYCFGKIDDASTHLLGVINDILDMSKIEANKFELSSAEFNFERLLQKVVNVVNFRVEEKQQSFTVTVSSNVPLLLKGDDQRIAQVITNLLSNAVKFTPDGGSIRLEADMVEEKGNVCTLEVSVTDTGIGITPEQQKRLFMSFEQAEANTTRKFGGTGLGLVICKNIVEMMGGKIWIESEPGKGSKFNFTIQVERGSSVEPSLKLEGVDWHSVNILVVDDMPEILEYFETLAGRVGFVCDLASGGNDALARIEAHGDYDVYFVDWRMPDMNGIELTRRIKSRSSNSVVIMISAMDWNAIEDEAQEAGVDHFLSKPLFPSVIVDTINKCLGLQAIEKPEKSQAEDEDLDFSGCRVLLAEDVEINREIVIALLEPTGLVVDTAENGAVALDMFRQNPDLYDMIFMDVQMPEMDGFSATQGIRAVDHPRAKTIPIVAMTANVFQSDVEKCLEAGMDDHVGKPIDFDEVMDKLQKFLPERK